MPYLTHEEYKEMGFDGLDDVKFDELVKQAGYMLDYVTNNFYHFTDLSRDNDFRSGKFKLAVASQVAYFNELGSSSYNSINSSPQSFSAGRTSVSNSSKQVVDGEHNKKSTVAEEVYMYLRGSGLLYAGVTTR